MNRVCVFCGSSFGTEKIFEEQAFLLGQALAERNITLVYGGANIGLMGVTANSVLQHQGKVIGVLPHFLKDKEIEHAGLSELIMVDTMHQRKMTMNELSDGVITLPGGFGTMEEFFEMLTWAQLGLHRKPIGILNIAGFYNELLSLMQSMVDKGFLKELNQRMLLVSDNINDLLQQMDSYQAPSVGQWITPDKV